MTQISIDTSVLIGLLDPKDVWHDPAMVLKAHHTDVTMFDCVLAKEQGTPTCRIGPHLGGLSPQFWIY
jgi:hypothetical protein